MKKMFLILILILLIGMSLPVFAPPQQETTVVTIRSYLFTWSGTADNSARTDIVFLRGPQATRARRPCRPRPDAGPHA